MGIQNRGDREKFSQLRQTLLHLANEIRGLVEPFFSDRPVIKGTVYELKRTCGKPGCKCARGELHGRMVVSASQGGKTRLGVIPHGCLVEVQAKVSRYQELRRSLSAATKKDGHLMVVCLLGGIHNFFGPMVGSIVFIFLDKLITSFTQYWPFVLGVVVLALVLFLRGGIAGSIAARIALRSER